MEYSWLLAICHRSLFRVFLNAPWHLERGQLTSQQLQLVRHLNLTSRLVGLSLPNKNSRRLLRWSLPSSRLLGWSLPSPARVEPAQQPTAEVVGQAQPNQPPSDQPFQVILKSTDLVNQAIIVIMEPTDRPARMRFELRETVNPPTRLKGVGSGKLRTWPSKVMGGASGGSTLELTRADSWSSPLMGEPSGGSTLELTRANSRSTRFS